jgi:hypothetical protein
VGSKSVVVVNGAEAMQIFGFFLPIFGFGFVLYFLPTIIAFARNKRDVISILVLNLLLGWTLIGWVISLVWALKQDVPAVTR